MRVEVASPDRYLPKAVNNELPYNNGRETTTAPPIDLRHIIPLAREGDPDALATLFDYTRPLVYKTLRAKQTFQLGSGNFEEIANETLAKLFTTVVKRYDPFLPVPESIPSDEIPTYVAKQYRKYVNMTANSKYVDFIRKESKENLTFIVTPNYLEENSIDPTIELLKTPKGKNLLTKAQKQLVVMRAQGYKYEEIEDETGIKMNPAKARIHRARRKIEKTFLYPVGFKPAYELVTPGKETIKLYIACSQGKIRAVHLLEMWYTQQEWFDEYIKNHIEPPLPHYVPPYSLVTNKIEYRYLSNNFSHEALNAINRDGRYYAHPDTVREFLDAKFPQRNVQAENNGIHVFP